MAQCRLLASIVMTVTDQYLANNAKYAETFTGPLPLPPSKHVAVVACMDARLDVYRILGLGDGEKTQKQKPLAGDFGKDQHPGNTADHIVGNKLGVIHGADATNSVGSTV